MDISIINSVQILSYAVLVALALLLGQFIQIDGNIMLAWPVGAITVWLTWKDGWKKSFLPIFLGSAVSIYFHDLEDLMAAQRILATLLTGIIGGELLRAFEVQRTLNSVRDILLLFFLGALLSTALSSFSAAIVVRLPAADWIDTQRLWWSCWLAEAFAIMLVMPVLAEQSKRPSTESWIMLALVITNASIVYADILPQGVAMSLPLSYTASPLLLFAAFRLPINHLGVLLLVNAIIATWGTANFMGPFTLPTVEESILALHGNLAILSITALIISAAIQERKQTNQALSDRNEELNFILENQSEALIRTCRQGNLLYATPSSYQLLAQETLPENLLSWFTQHNVPLPDWILSSKPAKSGEFTHKLGEKWIQWLIKSAGSDSDLFWTGHDVTAAENAKLASQKHLSTLTQFGRLSDMAQLAGGLAHELNQPLAAAITYAEAAQRIAGHSTACKNLIPPLNKLVKNAELAADIVRNTRAFLRAEDIRKQALQAKLFLLETVDLLAFEERHAGVTVKIECDDSAKLFAAPSQFQQVLVNLLRNSIQAIEREKTGGRITLSLSQEEDMDILSHKDNGPGIKAKDREHLFDTFRTSHSKGIGLGLCISRTIIKAHGGDLSLAQSDSGAAFIIKLPKVKESAHATVSNSYR